MCHFHGSVQFTKAGAGQAVMSPAFSGSLFMPLVDKPLVFDGRSMGRLACSEISYHLRVYGNRTSICKFKFSLPSYLRQCSVQRL